MSCAAWTVLMLSIALVAFPRPARAATVELQPTATGLRIEYRAEAAEVNDLSISKSGGYYVFKEKTAGVAGGGPGAAICEDLDPPDPHGARCRADGVVEIKISLNDQNDKLTIEDSASPPGPAPATPRIVAMGGDGVDTMTGGPGPEVFEGDAGNDPIDGGSGDDELHGGSGDDMLAGGDGNDRLDFGAADETAGGDTLLGGPGDDQLYGGPAGEQQDPDFLAGGDGNDTADFSARTSPLTIDLDGTADDGYAGEHDNVQPDVENVIGGREGDTLIGSGANNSLDGRDGDDQISGRGGDDTLDGGANDPGSDTLVGGDGNDMVNGRAGDDSADGGDGNDRLAGAGGTDTLDGQAGDDVLMGGAGGDTLDGGPGTDMLSGAEPNLVGADGSDTLDGGSGMDFLFGNDGNDSLDGGPGPDEIHGGAGRDTVTYENRSSRVEVTLDDMPNDGEANENDNVFGDVEIVLGGTVGDDLSGDGDANTLDGGSGEDLVTGNPGRDTLSGGNAPDLIQARDGDADHVDCGDDGDLAIVDRSDTVRDCKWVDRGGRRRLVVAQSALVRPTRGGFGLRLPDGHRFYDLENAVKIPIASAIDPEEGEVRVATARNGAGARQEVVVSAGVFSVRQETGRRSVTELRLPSGGFGACGRSSTGGRAAKDKPPRRLHTRVDTRKRGRFRVRGRYSIGGAVGTAWLTEDRCDGTFTQVESGTVRVRDLVRHTIVSVGAGGSYLARAP